MIRRAVPQDAAAIHELLRTSFAAFEALYTPGCFDATILDPARVRQRMQEGPIWVADQDGLCVGTVGARVDQRGLYVRGMAVHPKARRTGLGKALLDAVAAWGRAHDVPNMWLSTTLFLEGSIALYKRYGMIDADGPADLHGTPLRTFEMRLA